MAISSTQSSARQKNWTTLSTSIPPSQQTKSPLFSTKTTTTSHSRWLSALQDGAGMATRLCTSSAFTQEESSSIIPAWKIVIGHAGELIPFIIDRVEQQFEQFCGDRPLSLKQVWERNIWITTSGMFMVAPMACLLRNTRIGHIMFSVDYPFSETEQGREFLGKLWESGLVSKEGFEMIAYRNAEKLLGFKAVAE